VTFSTVSLNLLFLLAPSRKIYKQWKSLAEKQREFAIVTAVGGLNLSSVAEGWEELLQLSLFYSLISDVFIGTFSAD